MTAFIWLVLCQIDLPKYKMAYTEWLYILLTISVYLFSGHLGIWIGMFIYAGWVVIETFLFWGKDFKWLLRKHLF